MYGQPCQPAATFCSSAVGSQRPRQPSGVCPGTAGRRAQLSSPLARTIRRRTVHSAPTALSVCPGTAQLPSPLARTVRRRAVHSTRAGPRCLPKLGGSLNCMRARREPLRGGVSALAPALGVCPGWAVAQLYTRSARTIARRMVHSAPTALGINRSALLRLI